MSDPISTPHLGSADEWQRHVGFLRRLARGLLPDANEVEDVLQDTWIRAHRSHAGSRNPAWLAGVVRNVAAQLQRSKARRQIREERAASEEGQPSADETVARVELMRTLVDALDGLGEPYRTVLLARFLDELSPSEIARRQGLSIHTVRTRIRRGLEQLRARLKSDDGDESKWLPGLAALAESRRAIPAPTHTALTLLMSTKIQLAIGILALGLAVVSVGRSSSPTRPESVSLPNLATSIEPVQAAAMAPMEGAHHAPERPASKEARLAADAPRSRQSEPIAKPRDRGQSLVGTVRDVNGEPIEGAVLHLLKDRTLSGADGKFRITWRKGSQLPLYAEAPGYAQIRTEIDALEAGEERRVDITLSGELRVEGTVRDRSGSPVPDVHVTSMHTVDNIVLTDAAGRFSLGHMDRARATQELMARKQDWVQLRHEFATGPENVIRVELILDRGARVEGFVVDATGAPVSAATLQIGDSPQKSGLVRTSSRTDGAFIFPRVAPGPGKLVVQAPGFAPHRSWIDVPLDLDHLGGIRIQLAPGHFLEGQVLDPEGNRIPDVRVHPRLGDYILARHAVTDDRGAFRLDDLPSRELRLSLYPPSSSSLALASKDIAVDRVDVKDLSIVLERAGRIAGRIVDARSGAPVTRFRIRLTPPALEEGDEALSGYRSVWSDQGVTFEADDGIWFGGADTRFDPGGMTGIEVTADGYAPANIPRVRAETDPDPEDLVIPLVRGGSVSGTIADSATGLPVAGALVRIFHSSGRADDGERASPGEATHVRQTDPNGRFEFPAVGPGKVRLVVTAGGYSEWTEDPLVVTSGHASMRQIELRPVD